MQNFWEMVSCWGTRLESRLESKSQWSFTSKFFFFQLRQLFYKWKCGPDGLIEEKLVSNQWPFEGCQGTSLETKWYIPSQSLNFVTFFRQLKGNFSILDWRQTWHPIDRGFRVFFCELVRFQLRIRQWIEDWFGTQSMAIFGRELDRENTVSKIVFSWNILRVLNMSFRSFSPNLYSRKRNLIQSHGDLDEIPTKLVTNN